MLALAAGEALLAAPTPLLEAPVAAPVVVPAAWISMNTTLSPLLDMFRNMPAIGV